MSRTTMTAAFAAMMAVSMPLAYAQTTSTTPTKNEPAATAPVRTGVQANRIMPGQIRMTQMNGATVYDTQNRNIGDVKDMILDKDGKVAAVVLDVGSFLGVGGKYVAIPMNDVKVSFDNNSNKPHLAVDMTKEQLKAAQAFDLNEKKAATGSSTAPRENTKR